VNYRLSVYIETRHMGAFRYSKSIAYITGEFVYAITAAESIILSLFTSNEQWR